EFDPVSGFVSPSLALSEIFGSGTEAHPTLDAFLAHVHADDRDRVRRAIGSTERADNAASVCRVVRPDGSIRHLVHRSEPIRNLGSDVVLMLGVMLDVSAAVEEWRKVRASSAQPDRFREVFAQSPLPLIVSRDTVLLDVNEAFCEVTGRSWEEVI